MICLMFEISVPRRYLRKKPQYLHSYCITCRASAAVALTTLPHRSTLGTQGKRSPPWVYISIIIVFPPGPLTTSCALLQTNSRGEPLICTLYYNSCVTCTDLLSVLLIYQDTISIWCQERLVHACGNLGNLAKITHLFRQAFKSHARLQSDPLFLAPHSTGYPQPFVLLVMPGPPFQISTAALIFARSNFPRERRVSLPEFPSPDSTFREIQLWKPQGLVPLSRERLGCGRAVYSFQRQESGPRRSSECISL